MANPLNKKLSSCTQFIRQALHNNEKVMQSGLPKPTSFSWDMARTSECQRRRAADSAIINLIA
jgi:hypothetical protein